MANAPKDTVYIDVDDEITAIIDKVKSSDKKIVALVLPKRAAVLQSIVNMKLLKRTTDDAKKNLVLITSETGLLPLAGAVGIHVAKTLQSKPAIPAAPKTADSPIDVDQDDIDDVELDKAKPVGELADDETIEVDNDEPEEVAAGTAAVKKASGKKRIKIPNFDKFRVKIVLGVLALVLLIVGWIFAFMILPKATVTVKTDAQSIDADLELTASPAATELNEAEGIVPALSKELRKTETEKVPATGQQDKGTKAAGSMEVFNCTDNEVTVPAGTIFINNGLGFVTDKNIEVPASDFFSNGTCKKNTSADVDVTSTQPGDKYNLSADREYTSNFSSTLSGIGSAMTGGTSKIVKVVAQKDIDDAKQKIADRSSTVKDELQGDLDETGYLGLQDTFAAGAPAVTSSPNVNEEGGEVTVTVAITYTMLGIKKDDLKKLIEKSIEGKIDKSKQVILDDGLADAAIGIIEKRPNGEVRLTLSTTVLAGAQQDENAIKQEIAGKKKSLTLSAIKSRPGVTDAEVRYSPFWVSSTPKKTSKITVIFEQNASNDADKND
jgi:hypothetical protein